MDQDATQHGGRSRLRPHCVGPTSPSPKGGGAPNFSANICCECDQMAGCIKLPLGREVGLSPSGIVLDGDPAPNPQKGTEPPIFGPCVSWWNGYRWMKTPLGMEVDLGTGHIVLDGDPAPLQKGHSSPPLFGPCLVATFAHLSYCRALVIFGYRFWSVSFIFSSIFSLHPCGPSVIYVSF